MLALVTSVAGTAHAQTTPAGHVANSAVGEVGKRQFEGVTDPMGRIDSRIPSRIASRLRSRIDRNYDPRAKAVVPVLGSKYLDGFRPF